MAEERDPRVRTWLRVCLGGERLVDVARSLGYASGSAVHQVIRRLEIGRQQDMDLARRLEKLENAVRGVKS
jgi:hypothetical protein